MSSNSWLSLVRSAGGRENPPARAEPMSPVPMPSTRRHAQRTSPGRAGASRRTRSVDLASMTIGWCSGRGKGIRWVLAHRPLQRFCTGRYREPWRRVEGFSVLSPSGAGIARQAKDEHIGEVSIAPPTAGLRAFAHATPEDRAAAGASTLVSPLAEAGRLPPASLSV
jgi:hypothetical protein